MSDIILLGQLGSAAESLSTNFESEVVSLSLSTSVVVDNVPKIYISVCTILTRIHMQ